MNYIIYLHGFNSSPQSEKAQLSGKFFQKNDPSIKIISPALPPVPLDAISHIHDVIQQNGREQLQGFIGSSLGGFYSLYLQNFYSESELVPKTVLINPAIRPYDLLQDYLGDNKNMYTGETYTVEASHMEDLKSLVVPLTHDLGSIFLLTQTADEVLPYQDAVTHLAGVKTWVQFGGSHAFDGYADVLPSIQRFFKKS